MHQNSNQGENRRDHNDNKISFREAIDEIPLLDIKPYVSEFDAKDVEKKGNGERNAL